MVRHLLVLILAAGTALAQQPKLFDAALTRYGATVTATLPPGGYRDRHTPAESSCDLNAHSRCVFAGTGYSLTIELLDTLPIVKLGFAHSDYATEEAPKDLEISLDGGPAIPFTLELKRPEKRKIQWQELPVGKPAKSVKVTVKSNFDAPNKWGGLAEIAVWTDADLDKRLAPPDYNPDAPVFVQVPPLTAGAAVAQATLPPVAKPGEHPCLLLTPSELADLKRDLANTERGKEALAKFLGLAGGLLAAAPDFPDPKGPLGQLKDRGDDVAKRHGRLANGCGSLGMAYALTGERKYAERVREILVGYAQRYPDYPEHGGANKNDTGKVMGQRLSEAMWLIPLETAYDATWDCGLYTEADRALIAGQLIRPAVTFIRRAQPAAEVAARDKARPDWRTGDPLPAKGFVPNWVQYYNAATISAGVLLREPAWVDLAVAETRANLHNGIGADGMWNEGAVGYQMFVMQAFTIILEAAARQGIDLYSYDGCRYKRLFDSPLRYAYPDGTAPGIHDSGRVKFGDWSTMVYDYAWLRYGDPRHARLVNNSPRQLQASEAIYFPTRVYQIVPEPPVVHFPSTVFGNLGYAVLRDGPEAAQPRYALMDYGPHGGVHGHYDKLNLILFAGDELGGEPVFHRYEDPLHGEWTVQTVAHNTLTVNQRSQVATEGKLTVYADAGACKVMRAECADAYPGVVLDRTVVITANRTFDLYTARCARNVTFDRTLRFAGALALPAGATDGQPLGTSDGYQHLKLQAKAGGDTGRTLRWSDDKHTFCAAVAGTPGQELLYAQGPDKDGVVLLRQSGKSAGFAVAYPTDAPLTRLDTGDSGVLAVESGGCRVFVATKPGTWSAGGWRSDARVLVVDGDKVLLAGGQSAVNGERKLALEAAGTKLF